MLNRTPDIEPALWLRLTVAVLCCWGIWAACGTKPTLFRKVPASHSGIRFNNRVEENDSINPIDQEFLYNGGGVAVGDFNRDGLMDLYFTGSMVSNKLYLNQGGLRFRDITAEAGVSGEGEWSNGASVVDINNDGWPDIYVCVSIRKDPRRRHNLLYVNQGTNAQGVPVFKEMAAEYGLADTSYSVQAAFFDYDNDGDLDMYLVTTEPARREAAPFSANTGQQHDVDKLFRNDWNDSLGHPFFTDVSTAAGIVDHGYGLGVSIADINRDGWKDIYVTNDFLSSDQLYINNGNGTFTNKVATYFKHTSQNAMGNDIADIDNDGLADILTVDMNPPDNLHKKTDLGGGNYDLYRNMIYGNYMLQYVRNTLQWNRGPHIGPDDSTGDPIFSEIALYAGVAETDWSWSPSLADFDNDGYRDILITSGYPRDVTDHDYIAFRRQSTANLPKSSLLAHIPQLKLPNAAFQNNGNRRFSDVTAGWGLDVPGFSNGAAYVDLDNDGDLDYVVNNINEEAFVYENTTNNGALPATATAAPGWLDIAFHGTSRNPDGIGAWADIWWAAGKHQVYENNPCRGYLSCVAPRAHFGLGPYDNVDSVCIRWMNGKMQVLRNVRANRLLTVDVRDATIPYRLTTDLPAPQPLFTDVTKATGITYQHHQRDYNDFNSQRLLPHKLSQYGPALAVGDLDGNGLDDLVIGAANGEPIRQYLLQQADGHFTPRELPQLRGAAARYPANMGLLVFDADGDGFPDLYCASGGDEYPAGDASYQDQLWINDGKGNFHLDTSALPPNHNSKSAVKAADFDNDGDLDLFVGGRVLPGKYPLPVSSSIYRNDSRPGHPRFTDITAEVAPGLRSIGLVCDAIWTDYDNDGWTDLIVVGEWMSVRFFHNEQGKLVDRTAGPGVGGVTGWWNSIAAADLDNDGDIDYIVGNLGENSAFKASPTRPLGMYAADFDGNGTLDPILTLYLPDQKGNWDEYPWPSRDQITAQLPAFKKKFPSYAAYGKARISDLFGATHLKQALQLHATELRSGWFENLGHGQFRFHPLPPEAQLAPVYGIVAEDFDGDGNVDLALSGNDYGNEPSSGRYDAFNGLVLLGDGAGNFHPQSMAAAGLFIPGDGKALVELAGPKNTLLLAASQNGGPLKLFRMNPAAAGTILRLNPHDKALLLHLKNRKTRRQEAYYGTSFLSQSARVVDIGPAIQNVEQLKK